VSPVAMAAIFGLSAGLAAFASMIQKAFTAYSRPRLEEIILSAPPDRREAVKSRMEATLDRKDRAMKSAGLLKVALLLVSAMFGYLLFGCHVECGRGVLALCGVGLLVVVELVPQGLGRSYAEEMILGCGTAIATLSVLMGPLVAFSGAVEVGVDRLRGKMIPESQEEEIEEELKAIVSNGEAGGVLDDEARHMIESTFDMIDTDVAEVMTPRTDLVCIDVTATVEEVKNLATEAGHSRVPVFEETPDHVVGIFYVKDLLRYWGDDAASISLRDLMRPPYFIPESRPVWGLLKELQAAKVHIAVVLDEYGGTAGIVTVEDILEEIVGEIADEYDPEQKSQARKVDDLTFEFDARVHVDEINEEMHIAIPEEEDFDTLAGFMISHFGRIPAAEESFESDGVRFTVLEADDRRIGRARVQKLPGAASDA